MYSRGERRRPSPGPGRAVARGRRRRCGIIGQSQVRAGVRRPAPHDPHDARSRRPRPTRIDPAAVGAAHVGRGDEAVRMRRPHDVSRAARRGRDSRRRGAGRRGPAALPCGAACPWSRAAPGRACRAARCRTSAASLVAWRSSAASSRSTRWRARRSCSPACAISRSPRPSRRTVSITRRTRRRRSPARSAATSPRTRAACTVSSTG